MSKKSTGGASTYGMRKKNISQEYISQLDALFIEIADLKRSRTIERIRWRIDGKGDSFDNIPILNRKIISKRGEIKKLCDTLERKNISIPEKYDLTYFMIRDENLKIEA